MKVNKQIKSKNIKLIDENGSMVGVVNLRAAQDMAIEKGLDLVEVSVLPDMSICKIMDYGKYRYEMEKKSKSSKKVNTQILKEILLHFTTSDNDVNSKMEQAKTFLAKFSKVQVSLVLKKYELKLADRAIEKMRHVAEILKPFAKPNVEEFKLSGKVIKVIFTKI